MYKLILVPLDGSHRAEGILLHVKMLAACTGAEILLLQVVPPDSVIIDLHGAPPAINADILELRTQEADAYLKALSTSLVDQGYPCRTWVEIGPVVDTIIQVAAREDVGLVAMASHGRTGLGRVFYGSVAAGVLHMIDRPLLLIRADGS